MWLAKMTLGSKMLDTLALKEAYQPYVDMSFSNQLKQLFYGNNVAVFLKVGFKKKKGYVSSVIVHKSSYRPGVRNLIAFAGQI